jgi:transketolase
MDNIVSTREAYGRALAELGAKYDFVVLDADLSKATKTDLFAGRYPERFFNMGISEGDMMGTAAGLASCGKTVFASSFAVFAAGRAFEQVRNSIAYPGLNVKIGASHGGVLIGEDGASHQAIEDISLMRTLPGMAVVVPSDDVSAALAVEAAILWEGPVYLRFNRFAAGRVYATAPKFEIGRGIVLRDGTDGAIFAIGDMVIEALKAAGMLEGCGVSVAVIDMHTIKPIDRDLIIHFAAKTGRIVTAEDHSVIGGLGSAVAEVVAETGNACLKRVGIQDCFGRSGSRQALAEYFGLTAEGIRRAFQSMLEGNE